MTRIWGFISLCTGVSFLFFAIRSAIQGTSSKPIWNVLHVPSLLFVFLILMGFGLIAYGLKNMLATVVHAVFSNPRVVEARLTSFEKKLKQMSDNYYERGVSGLRESVPSGRLLPVWQGLIYHLEIKLPLNDIELLLQKDARDYRARMNSYLNILSTLSTIAPSVGVLGTVLGLVRLLASLQDPSSIGPNMSLALLTTLYGIFFGTIILKPMILRMELLRNNYLSSYKQALFWIGLIRSKKPTFYLNEKYSQMPKRKK